MLCILLFLVIDIVMLGAVTSITGSRYSTKEIPDKEHPETFIDVRRYNYLQDLHVSAYIRYALNDGTVASGSPCNNCVLVLTERWFHIILCCTAMSLSY